MTFETLIELCGGELLNSSSLLAFNDIKFSAKDVKLGDLFVYSDFEDLDFAIKNGAYGVLIDKKIEIVDKEITWILVDSLHFALIKILRFFLLQKDIKFIYLKDIEFQLFKSIINRHKVTTLGANSFENFKKIINSKTDIFISQDKNFLEKIYPNFLQIKSIKNNIEIIEHSTFVTSFIYKKHYFKDIKISTLFIKNFNAVLDFLDEQKIPYDIYNCDFISHFRPFFVNKRLIQKGFATTESILIFEDDIFMIEKELEFLKYRPTWREPIVFLPKRFEKDYANRENFIFFNEKEDFLKIKNIDFNFIFILANHEEFFEVIKHYHKKKQTTLF